MSGEPTTIPAATTDSPAGGWSDSTTTREQFRQLAREHRVVPVTRKVLSDAETPLSAYRKLADVFHDVLSEQSLDDLL